MVTNLRAAMPALPNRPLCVASVEPQCDPQRRFEALAATKQIPSTSRWRSLAAERRMHRRAEHRRERVQWVFCLTAVAQMVERLPALYRVVEAGDDDVRLELHLKASAWEILRLGPADPDHVAVTLSGHLDNVPGSRFEPWLAGGIEALNADLQWAVSRPCSEQASELLSALVRMRGTMLHGNLY